MRDEGRLQALESRLERALEALKMLTLATREIVRGVGDIDDPHWEKVEAQLARVEARLREIR